MKNTISLLWLAPFAAFIGGYTALALLIGKAPLPVPSYIGNTITHAMIDLSQKKLSSQIAKIKIDNDLPEGTILGQTPRPGSMIKPQQTIFFVVSKKELCPLTPNLLGKVIGVHNDFRQEAYSLYNNAPIGICFAQYPSASTPLERKSILCYCSAGEMPYKIMPKFQGARLEIVEDRLKELGYAYEVTHKKSFLHKNEQIIVSQSPLAGTILNTKKPFTIKLVAE